LKILTRVFLALLLLLLTIWVLVQFTPVQNWLVRQASRKLSKELQTEVSIKHVDFSLFNKMLLEGVLVKDRNKDTLAYIGRAGLNISDWFFLKDKAVISNANLEHTNIFLHRTDSIWNYQFLVDYFGGSSTSSGKKKKGIELSLQKVSLTDFHVVQKDEWRGETMEGKIGFLKLSPNEINFNKQIIDIDRLEIEQPYFAISNYDGKRPKRPSKPDSYYHQNDSIPAGFGNKWIIKANSVFITDGEFRNDIATERKVLDYFDPLHIRFHSINAAFTQLRIKGDTLQSHIKLNLKERSGFEVTNMDAMLKWNSTSMEFSNLLLETPKSRLTNYFALRYKNFLHDMNSFISHVTMEGTFSKSRIHTDDIAWFAPQLKDINDVAEISGKSKGTVEHLKAEQVLVKTGKETVLEGSFLIDGLPDIENTFLDIKAKQFHSSYSDVLRIYPGLKSITTPALNKISNLNFKGSFSGYFKDFVTYGTIETNLGTLVSDLNFKIPKDGQPVYSGKLKTTGFELGQFLNEPLVGKIVMEGSLKGRGFRTKTLFAEIDTKLKQLELKGYNYHNIEAKGIIDKRKFDGALSINDTSLVMNMTGMIDIGKDTPVYKVNGNIFSCNFKSLNLTKQDLFLSGDFDFNFKVKSINDFLGTAVIRNATLLHNSTPLSLDSLFLSHTYLANGQKQLLVQSNELNATVTGNYNLVYLPDVTLAFLHNYFPAYIPAPKRKIQTQQLDFNIETKNISPFLGILKIPVSGFDQSTISGNINIQENKFNLNTHVPSFEYKGILFDNVNLNGQSNLNQLSLNGSISQVRFNDSLNLPNTNFSLAAANDTGFVTIRTSASQTLKDANLNAHFKASQEGFTITFEPSTLLLNEKKWTIEDESDFFIGKGSVFSNGIKLTSGNEEIFAYTHPSEIGSYNDIVVELRKIQIGDILPYFLTDPRLEGSVTGRIDVMNPLGKMQIDGRFTAEKFRFNNDSVGLVTINSNFNTTTGEINYEAESDNLLHRFKAKGTTNISDPKQITTDNILVLDNEPLSVIQKYLTIIMTDIKGTGSGTLRLKGTGTKPDIIGSIKLNKASFILDYTKCRYTIENGTILNFREGELDFGNLKLKDTLGRSGTFSGKLYHNFFSNMAFDLSFKADDARKGLLVLNTTKRDNTIFYGKVVANASGSITGPLADMTIRLRGEPTDSSTLSIPTSDSRVTGTADFIVFRTYGKEMQVQSNIKESSNMTVDLDVIANPLAKVYLILDEITNDVIEGQGNGAINMRVSTNEKTTMSGNFEITQGRYTFNWQSLFKRPFLIDRGTINWNGDPYDARINIDANYLVENVSLLPSMANGCSNERNNIVVVSNLSNTLKNPLIKFRFELPQGHPCRNNPLTISAFNQLYNNQDELNRQVISLLMMGSFISSNTQQTTLATSNVGTSFLTNAAGTLSEFIAQQVTNGLDAVFKNIPGLKDLKLDPYLTFSPSLISGAQATGIGFQGTSRFGITRRMMNGRLLIKAGGSLLVGAGGFANTQYNNQLTPDIALEWLITPDGKLRLIGFYRTIFDIQRRNDRTGVSLSFTRERNTLADLFRNDKKVQKEYQLFTN